MHVYYDIIIWFHPWPVLWYHQYFLFYRHVVTLVSSATVRVIGCCCKSAVQDPQPALLGTTVPPRWNTGTWRRDHTVNNSVWLLYSVDCCVRDVRRATHGVQSHWQIQSSGPLVYFCRVCVVPQLSNTQNISYVHTLTFSTIHLWIRLTSSDPGSKTLTSVTPGSVTGHTRRALPAKCPLVRMVSDLDCYVLKMSQI